MDIAAYFTERVSRDCWAVCYSSPEKRKTLMMTQDQIAAVMCAQIAERAYMEGFEAGLVAQKYFPADIKAFGYRSAASLRINTK